jgi:hypothetical protein
VVVFVPSFIPSFLNDSKKGIAFRNGMAKLRDNTSRESHSFYQQIWPFKDNVAADVLEILYPEQLIFAVG